MAKKKNKKKKKYEKKYKKLKSKYKKLKLKLKKKSSVKKTPKRKNKQLQDHSSNYNVNDAVAKLRKLKSVETINIFTKGDKRITVLKALKSRKNALSK